MHLALYRKYRPTTFDDVVGQEHITATLRSEVAKGSPAHAYLFTGSRGTGKTTCAKILAKALNCRSPENGNPCGTCEVCRGIDDGSVLDVLEIDAASNNGVDNIRDLRDEAGFTPAVGSYRVYIIDEVHMLSIGAFNALLKIMEEPPPHVVFILATTEVHKIPATILSRCQRFDFYRISQQAIAGRLEYIARQEGFSVTPQAALTIAALSDGALRDAVSLLDLCSSYSSDITEEVVRSASGTVGSGHLFALADAVLQNSPAAALELLEQLTQKSMEEGRLCTQLAAHFRDLMLVGAAGDALLECSPDERQRLEQQAAGFSMPRILYSIRVLQDALTAMNRSINKRTELEIALIKLCDLRLSQDTDALLARIEKLETQLAGRQSVSAVPLAQEQQAQPVKEELLPQPPAEQQAQPPQEKQPVQPVQEHRVQRLDNWREILARLERSNPALYAALLHSSAYQSGSRVLIDCRDDFFLRLMRENEYAKDCLKQAIQEVTGTRCGIGPYRQEAVAEQQQDPMQDFIQKLETLDLPKDRVHIE